jgi:sugar phosphate isomerase/epimerase
MKKAVQQIMFGSVMNGRERTLGVLDRISKAGYDGIELNGFMIHPMNFAVKMLTKAAGMPVGSCGKLDWHGLIRDSGLCVTSIHTDLGSLERDPAVVAEETKSFGAKYSVITGMYRFDYTDPMEVTSLAARLNSCGRCLKEQGVELLYHNHNCELLRAGGKRAYEILIEETDPEYVNFEFDSFWFADGGASPAEYMEKLGSRMRLWHVTDRGARPAGKVMTPIVKCDSVELGHGNMPLDGLIGLAERAGTEAVILESHRNWIDGDPVKSMEISAEYLNGRV